MMTAVLVLMTCCNGVQREHNKKLSVTVRVSNDIRAVKLHDIGFTKKSCFAAARAADDKNILVSRVLRVFGAVGHHQPFRLRQQHIVVKDGINERLDVCRCTP